MKQILYFVFLVAILMHFGCTKYPEQTAIDYYITSTKSNSIEFLSFSLLNVKAHLNNTNLSVYLDPVDLFFHTSSSDQPDTIYLGRSAIEPGIIEGYDYWITNGRCLYSGFILNLLNKEHFESIASPANILIKEGEVKKIIFTIDTDESIVMTSNRDFKLLPKIHVAA